MSTFVDLAHRRSVRPMIVGGVPITSTAAGAAPARNEARPSENTPAVADTLSLHDVELALPGAWVDHEAIVSAWSEPELREAFGR